MKRLARVLLVPVVLLGAMTLWYARRDHVRVIDRRAGALARVDTLALGRLGAGVDRTSALIEELRLESDRGLSFPARIRRPPGGIGGRLPAVLLLAGVETGRDAVLLTPIDGHVVQMAIDYPYDGPQLFTKDEIATALPRLRSAAFDAAAACIVAVDYLASRPDVHPDSLYIVGASFGAFFGPIAAAARDEVDALVILQGGGDLRRLIEANLRYGGIESFERPLSIVGAALLHPFEPTRWVGRISPREVILISSTGDERIPRPCVDALFDACREPRRMIWIESGHLHPTDRELIERMTRAVETALFGADPPVTPRAAPSFPGAPPTRSTR